MTEVPGRTPEQVELLVTRPLEFMLNGATGVQRVRSTSGVGLSIVWVEFTWGTDIYQARQIVAEKLQLVRERLPRGEDLNPTLAPISSIMGEIMLLGLRPIVPPVSEAEATQKAIDVRTLAEFTLRNRLLAVEGVAQVTVMGGTLKQFQIVTSPERLAAQNITLEQLVEAAEKANVTAGGGIAERLAKEYLIQISGQSLSLADLEQTPVVWRQARPVLIKEVADVRIGGPVKRGDGSLRQREDGGTIIGGPTAILTVQKQPHYNTLALNAKLDQVLDEFAKELPPDIKLERHIFRQADFIQAAIGNVTEAIRDGILWVFLILFLFLWNVRTSLITLTAIPLSILLTALVFHYTGLVFPSLPLSINTMTLGGIAVAVGELVDDAIVDIENIYRRLKEKAVSTQRAGMSEQTNRETLASQREGGAPAEPPTAGDARLGRSLALPDHGPPGSSDGQSLTEPLQTVYEASSEIRNSIVYATLIVCLVVLPLFAMGGLEGRMFAPLGLAYMVSLFASLLVSLTVTPALASYLLPGAKFIQQPGDPLLLRWLKRLDEPVIRFGLRHPYAIMGGVAALSLLAVGAVFSMGGEFLPPFNEGTLTINAQAEPGTSLTESDRLGRRLEHLLLEVPEVLSVARRTGRAEMDEHAEGVHSSELDVRLLEYERPKPGVSAALLRGIPGLHRYGVVHEGRPRDEVLADIRARVTSLPGVRVNVGQPISHRIDHIMSGIRAQIAVKVFGPDLQTLRNLAQDVQAKMLPIRGVVDLQVEPQVEVPQLRLAVKRADAAAYGLKPGDLAKLLETAYKGRTVSQIFDEDRYYDLVVWYDERARNDLKVIGSTIIDTPSGRKVALDQVADVRDTTGPNALNREQAQRRIVVSCNVQGRDLAGVVADIQAALQPLTDQLRQLPGNYRIEYGGQFEAQQQANRRLLFLGILAVGGVFFLLYFALQSWAAALQVLVNIPLAAIGSVLAILLTNPPSGAQLSAASLWQWPGVWLAQASLSVAHWIGFITLIGIVSRNGIMMISHYQHLLKHEGEQFGEHMIVRGTLERLAPVLMTASVAIMGLVPLALGAGQTGKEILHPLAVVVIGGLLVSTLLDQLVTPALFYAFGRSLK
ncbi:multidrug transporter AcrB [Planctomycetaceae bacterium SCGC AG-212-F19]|nr:multidrug transporter AcrB [Planctomycetaceae bacterium SCGC AG-212-F19]